MSTANDRRNRKAAARARAFRMEDSMKTPTAREYAESLCKMAKAFEAFIKVSVREMPAREKR